MRKLFQKDLILVVFLTVLCTIFLLISPLNKPPVRIIPSLILLFFLPGYSLIAALFPKKDDLGCFKRFFLSFIVSMVIVLLLGVASKYIPLGIRSTNIFMIISTFTIFSTFIAYIKRIRLPIDERFKKPTKVGEKPYFPGDLALVLLITALCIIFVLIPPLDKTPIRIVLGLFLILFLPGYSLIAAFFPKKGDLDGIERVALSFGLSIAIVPLLGLILNYTQFGIKLTPILIILSIFTISLVIVSYLRRVRLPAKERFMVRFGDFLGSANRSFKKKSKVDRILSVILIISIILAISMTVYIIIKPKQGEKFTEFYILGPKGKASDYPINLTVGEEGKVIIGIVNHEYKTTSYHLVVKYDGTIIKKRDVTLANNRKWESPFTFTAANTGEDQKLEFLLYKDPDKKNVYRSLHLWIDVA